MLGRYALVNTCSSDGEGRARAALTEVSDIARWGTLVGMVRRPKGVQRVSTQRCSPAGTTFIRMHPCTQHPYCARMHPCTACTPAHMHPHSHRACSVSLCVLRLCTPGLHARAFTIKHGVVAVSCVWLCAIATVANTMRHADHDAHGTNTTATTATTRTHACARLLARQTRGSGRRPRGRVPGVGERHATRARDDRLPEPQRRQRAPVPAVASTARARGGTCAATEHSMGTAQASSGCGCGHGCCWHRVPRRCTSTRGRGRGCSIERDGDCTDANRAIVK